MALFDGMNNPWAPGGQMSPRMPWAQPGLNYGWGHGNEFFTPKTKEQIRDEGLLQLAVLAAILVAPALVGAAGGAGAASGASAAGAGAAGASAEAAGAALAQGAGAAAGAAGAGAGLSAATWASIAGGAATAAILRPFLQPDSSQALLQAARMGEVELNRELQRRSKEDCNCPPKPRFATEEWERKYGGCECESNVGSESSHRSVRWVLSKLVNEIGRDPVLQRRLIGTSNGTANAEERKVTKKSITGLMERILAETIPDLGPINDGWHSDEIATDTSRDLDIYDQNIIIQDQLPNTPARRTMPRGSSNPNNPSNPLNFRCVLAGFPPTLQRINSGNTRSVPRIPSKPGLLNLDSATFVQVYEHLQKVIFYESVTNPQLGMGQAPSSGQFAISEYFSGMNFGTTPPLAGFGPFPATNTYTFVGNIPGGQSVTISFDNCTNAETMQLPLVTWSDGPGSPPIPGPHIPGTPIVITLWNGARSTIEGPQMQAVGTAATISITTPTINWLGPPWIIGSPRPPAPSPAIYSIEGSRLYNIFGGISNYGVAIYERWMAAAQLQHYPRDPCGLGILIPTTIRCNFGPSYLQPWTVTDYYHGEPIPSKF